MKQPIGKRLEVIRNLVSRKIGVGEAANCLGVTRRSIERYRQAFVLKGEFGLRDRRKSNNIKLKPSDRENIIALKSTDPWRSARNIRDELGFLVTEHQIQRIIRKAGLAKQNLKRVKAIIRFEARYPNELWQTDIQGKISFPNIGVLYLIATLDDYSRFVPSGRWFETQGKMNVFYIWYESLARWGLPDKMLQDEGRQYKALVKFGQADYQWYAKALGIELIWAHKAETKGKIERFWGFVQKDFVPGVIKVKTIEGVNGAFKIWLAKYNYVFKSRYWNNQTHWSRYSPSQRQISRTELHSLLVVEERRKVTRESTISLYGKHYFVPKGYIGCRIWVKVVGNKLYFEAKNQVFHKTRLRF